MCRGIEYGRSGFARSGRRLSRRRCSRIAALRPCGGDAAAVAVIYHALNFGVMVLLGVVGMWMTDLSFGRLVAATQTQGN